MTENTAVPEPLTQVAEEAQEAEPSVQVTAEVKETAAPEQEELERLRSELEKAQAQAAEYLNGWQRAQAEFSNYRKRQEAERAQLIALANAGLLRKLLPVVDDFERAFATLPDGLNRLTWCEGILLIKHKLEAILESEGVKPIATEGQVFDPLYHEAITYEEVEGYEEGRIIGEVQRGYMLGERVLRPALVRVAKASVRPEAQAAASTEEGASGS
ncbi:MAG: nucleotide exchange factor GrpE [Anaerolineae bacterium]|nr:nucleotide exchange factor GrpE [Anaerolineae bacterium]